MAYGRREGSNVGGCHHYLDGVPVKISEKFRPPRKITLPLSYQQRYPVELLNDEYDFSLENHILELAEARRKAAEATEHAKAEQLGTSIEEFTRVAPPESKLPLTPTNWSNDVKNSDEAYYGSGGGGPCNDSQDENGVPKRSPNESKNGFVMNTPGSLLEPNSMLKPVPSSSKPLVLGKPDVTITSKLNLEDFEAESSPFEDVALKTLNDLEELESVLQNVNLSNNTLIGEVRPNQTVEMTVEMSGSTITTQEEYPVYSIPVDTMCNQRDCDKSNDLATKEVFSGRGPVATDFPSVPSTPHLCPSSLIESSLCSPEGYPSVAAGNPTAFLPSSAGATYAPTADAFPTTQLSPNEEIPSCVVALHNSRSTPDLLKELGATLAAEREKKKYVPNLVHSKRVGSSSNHGVELDSDQSSFDSKAYHNADETFRTEQDNAVQDLVHHIAEMGFPLARVERAIRTFKGDHKKIIDHLCMVHSFIEMGYAVEDAEMAVFSPLRNEMQAKEYLDVVIQLRDLGFDDKSIQEALAQCDNDRDKALDLLLS